MFGKADSSSFEYNTAHLAEDDSKYQQRPLSFPSMGRAGTYQAWPRSFHLSVAAVRRPLRRAATKDAGKHQRTLFTALTKLRVAPAACSSNMCMQLRVPMDNGDKIVIAHGL